MAGSQIPIGGGKTVTVNNFAVAVLAIVALVIVAVIVFHEPTRRSVVCVLTEGRVCREPMAPPKDALCDPRKLTLPELMQCQSEKGV